MLLPRFHPLITDDGWMICDGHADTEHSLAVPYIEEPCDSRGECLALCAILEEDV